MAIEQQEPTRVILEQPRGWSRWSNRIAWIVAGLAVMSALGSAAAYSQYFQRDSRVVEKWHSLSRTAADKIAIVNVSGAIMGGDGFASAQLDQVADDPTVKAIVLRVDSPGGTVSHDGRGRRAVIRAMRACSPALRTVSPGMEDWVMKGT